VRALEQAQGWDPLASRYAVERGERFLERVPRQSAAEARESLVKAREQFERAARLSPWVGQTWLRVGLTRWRLGHAETALPAMRRAVKRDPNSRAAALQLAAMLRASGRFDELQQLAQRQQPFNAADPRWLLWEAVAWEGLQRPGQAAHVYRTTVERFPASYQAWFGFAELLRREGDREGAAACYRAFQDVAPPGLQASRAVAQAFLDAAPAGH